MFIPLHDDTPLKVIRFQWMTGALILLNTLLFLFTHFAGGGAAEEVFLRRRARRARFQPADRD
jgi:hypothetical protein